MRVRNKMGWEGSINASPFLLRWHYLVLCNMYMLVCADTVQLLTTTLQGLRSVFYSSTNPSFTSHCSQTTGSPVGPEWRRHLGHYLDPIHASLKEKTAKALGPSLVSGQVPKTHYWYCNHAQGHRKGSGLQPESQRWDVERVSFEAESSPFVVFLQARGEESWKKSQGKDNWSSGKCRWCQETSGKCGGVKTTLQGHKKRLKKKKEKGSRVNLAAEIRVCRC